MVSGLIYFKNYIELGKGFSHQVSERSSNWVKTLISCVLKSVLKRITNT